MAAALKPVTRPDIKVVTIGKRIASISSRRCASSNASAVGVNAPGAASTDGVSSESATNPPTGAGSSRTFGLLGPYPYLYESTAAAAARTIRLEPWLVKDRNA